MPGKAALQNEDCINGRLMEIPQGLFTDIAMGMIPRLALAGTYRHQATHNQLY